MKLQIFEKTFVNYLLKTNFMTNNEKTFSKEIVPFCLFLFNIFPYIFSGLFAVF